MITVEACQHHWDIATPSKEHGSLLPMRCRRCPEVRDVFATHDDAPVKTGAYAKICASCGTRKVRIRKNWRYDGAKKRWAPECKACEGSKA